MEHTEQQKAIFDCIENTDHHIIINAGAGTGKTTTIVEAANKIGNNKAAFLAFNKSIATELAERLPEGVEAKTFHAFGFAAIRNAGIKTRVNNFKLNNIIKDFLGKDFTIAPLKKLVSLIKGSLIDPSNRKEINRLIDEYNIQFHSEREEEIAIAHLTTLLKA